MLGPIPPDEFQALVELADRQARQARLWLAENGHRAAGPRKPPPGSSGASRAAAKATRLRRLRLAEAALPPAPPSGR